MYRANDGSLHYTKESAMEANTNTRRFWTFIFHIIPNLIGAIVGFILGLCFKIGIVGRIITTVFVSVFVFLIAALSTENMVNGDGITFSRILQVIFCFGVLIGTGILWWLHYGKIKDNDIPYTVKVIQRCAIYCFWGTIFLFILFGILGLMKIISGEGIWFVLAFVIPFLIALFGTYIPAMTNPEIIDLDEMEE
jgi:hypothetical protein